MQITKEEYQQIKDLIADMQCVIKGVEFMYNSLKEYPESELYSMAIYNQNRLREIVNILKFNK